MEGVADKKAILDRYNELMMNYSDETVEEGAKLQDIIDSQNLWDLDSQVEMAMEALRCPPGEASIDNLSGGEKRRVALCQLLLRQPDLLLLDEPTNHLDAETVAWLEKHLREYPGAVMIDHPRSLLPRQRHRLDPRTRSWPRHPLRGQLHRLSGSQGQAPEAGRPRGGRTPARIVVRAGVDCLQPQGARQAKSKARIQRL